MIFQIEAQVITLNKPFKGDFKTNLNEKKWNTDTCCNMDEL